jgi:hypothetical protein
MISQMHTLNLKTECTRHSYPECDGKLVQAGVAELVAGEVEVRQGRAARQGRQQARQRGIVHGTLIQKHRGDAMGGLCVCGGRGSKTQHKNRARNRRG